MSTNLVETLPGHLYPSPSATPTLPPIPPPPYPPLTRDRLHPPSRFVVLPMKKRCAASTGVTQPVPAPPLPAAAVSLSIYMDQQCSSSRMNCTGELDATLSGAAQAWSVERPPTTTPAPRPPTHFTPPPATTPQTGPSRPGVITCFE